MCRPEMAYSVTGINNLVPSNSKMLETSPNTDGTNFMEFAHGI